MTRQHPWLAALVLTLAVGGCSRTIPPITWDAVRQDIATTYPSVRQLSTYELASWLRNDTLAQPVLLDVRTEKEFVVSHLSGARHTDPTDPGASLLDLSPDTPIVAYCSVGYRSSHLASELQNLGFTNVFNLDGSIFAWANEGRPLESEAGATTRVHPYSRWWGRLLEDRSSR